MNHVLRDAIGKICLVYLDDIIVFSSSIEDHIVNLQTIFNLLKEANLKMKVAKCRFWQRAVQYLGHILSEQGLTPDSEKISAIKNYKRPGGRSSVLLSSIHPRFR